MSGIIGAPTRVGIYSDDPVAVQIVDDSGTQSAETVLNRYGEISSVAAGVESTILSYVVPLGKLLFLNLVEGSGGNIAEYAVYINGDKQAKKRTYFGGELNVDFSFEGVPKRGLLLEAGDMISIKALHARPTSCDFEARVVGVLRG